MDIAGMATKVLADIERQDRNVKLLYGQILNLKARIEKLEAKNDRKCDDCELKGRPE